MVFLIRTRRVGATGGRRHRRLRDRHRLRARSRTCITSAPRPDAALAVQVIRGFGTAIMHGGTATLLAMISITLYEKRPHGGPQLLLPGFLAAVALHTGLQHAAGAAGARDACDPGGAAGGDPPGVPLQRAFAARLARHGPRLQRAAAGVDHYAVRSSTVTRAATCRPCASASGARISRTCCAACDCTANWRYAPRGCCCLRESGVDEPPIDDGDARQARRTRAAQTRNRQGWRARAASADDGDRQGHLGADTAQPLTAPAVGPGRVDGNTRGARRAALFCSARRATMLRYYFIYEVHKGTRHATRRGSAGQRCRLIGF